MNAEVACPLALLSTLLLRFIKVLLRFIKVLCVSLYCG